MSENIKRKYNKQKALEKLKRLREKKAEDKQVFNAETTANVNDWAKVFSTRLAIKDDFKAKQVNYGKPNKINRSNAQKIKLTPAAKQRKTLMLSYFKNPLYNREKGKKVRDRFLGYKAHKNSKKTVKTYKARYVKRLRRGKYD